MADRIDRPRNVMAHKNPRQSAPQQAKQRAVPTHRNQRAHGCRQGQTKNDPYVVHAINRNEKFIF